MGIKTVNALLFEKARFAFQNILLLTLYGRKIAVDGNNWIWTNLAIAYKESVMRMVDPLAVMDRSEVIQRTKELILSFIIKMAEYGITIVWCWDGKPLPDKEACRTKRRADRAKIAERVNVARTQLENVHILARTPSMITDYKKLLCQTSCVTPDEIGYFRDMIRLFGFPCLQAEYEGEKICANLASEGLVAGVWSTDTDNYPLGTPLMITGFNGVDEQQRPLISVVFLPYLLQGLGITHNQLTDLCIMLGCDFNKNMPNVGKKRCWDLMVKYGSIEAAEAGETKRDFSILRYRRCRELFAPQATGFNQLSKEINFDPNIFGQYSRDAVRHYKLDHRYDSLIIASKYLIAHIPKPTPKRSRFVSSSNVKPKTPVHAKPVTPVHVKPVTPVRNIPSLPLPSITLN